MTKLIIITGFAQSGKSTSVDYLVNHKGYYNASTSRLLGQVTEQIAWFLADRVINTKDKSTSVDINGIDIEMRNLKIMVAENCIVPILGREALVAKLAKDCIKQEKVVYECFNREEYELFRYYMRLDSGEHDITIAEVRSEREQPEVDERQLLEGGTLISNNGTIAELRRRLDNIA